MSEKFKPENIDTTSSPENLNERLAVMADRIGELEKTLEEYRGEDFFKNDQETRRLEEELNDLKSQFDKMYNEQR